MKSAIAKRSVVLRGHKTSVSLEDEFWDGLREIAALEKTTLAALLERIDGNRDNANLSSAIRIHVFNFYRNRAETELNQPHARRGPPSGPARRR
ncbi:MAG: ribbon-helix-helix domain-containing protein [Pseudolabrys sp.]